jgi:leucine-rich repeat protein SHOC2
MKEAGLEQIIEQARLEQHTHLYLDNKKINTLPENIENLSDLTGLSLRENQLNTLPESIGNLTNLTKIDLNYNKIATLPDSISNLSNLIELSLCGNKLITLSNSICNISNLMWLDLCDNQLSILPDNVINLSKLVGLNLEGNPLTDLSILQRLPNLEDVYLFGVYLPHKYWTKFSEWKPEWLFDEDNVEIRRTLIQQVGYDKIAEALGANILDIWEEYTLLKINVMETYHDPYRGDMAEPTVLLKMTCPSTQHIHILRVPPEMTSAEAAITWVNHGIHPDEFAVQT